MPYNRYEYTPAADGQPAVGVHVYVCDCCGEQWHEDTDAGEARKGETVCAACQRMIDAMCRWTKVIAYLHGRPPEAREKGSER